MLWGVLDFQATQ